ncbi:serine hydrolase [Nonomuraea sp. KM90]|uniref:serine hydrolase n=1 Tax=Nonomuraea sp. KM90 TaxID=3457428 RepID=UPI003FCEDEBA
MFKIGSITKIWTATLIQHLVDDGVLDLDRPVRDYLPGFRLRDPAATDFLTARRLLTHTGASYRSTHWRWLVPCPTTAARTRLAPAPGASHPS